MLPACFSAGQPAACSPIADYVLSGCSSRPDSDNQERHCQRSQRPLSALRLPLLFAAAVPALQLQETSCYQLASVQTVSRKPAMCVKAANSNMNPRGVSKMSLRLPCSPSRHREQSSAAAGDAAMPSCASTLAWLLQDSQQHAGRLQLCAKCGCRGWPDINQMHSDRQSSQRWPQSALKIQVLSVAVMPAPAATHEHMLPAGFCVQRMPTVRWLCAKLGCRSRHDSCQLHCDCQSSQMWPVSPEALECYRLLSMPNPAATHRYALSACL